MATYPKEIQVAKAKDAHGNDLYIYRYDDNPQRHYLDSGSDRCGGKQYMELPRAYKSLRGAKQGAALLTGEKLTWSATCN
jgi:hypothetical protein